VFRSLESWPHPDSPAGGGTSGAAATRIFCAILPFRAFDPAADARTGPRAVN
jgi:hypothetical protein